MHNSARYRCRWRWPRFVLQQLHRLKEPYREVFTLRVLGELHFRDIADLFGKSESWAKVTFYRAKDKLIEDMEEHHEH